MRQQQSAKISQVAFRILIFIGFYRKAVIGIEPFAKVDELATLTTEWKP